MYFLRPVALRAASSASRSILSVPRASRSFSSQSLFVQRRTTLNTPFQRRFASDDASQQKPVEEVKVDETKVEEVAVPEPVTESSEAVNPTAASESTPAAAESSTASGTYNSTHDQRPRRDQVAPLVIDANPVLYFGNLTFNVTEAALQELLLPLGEVESVRVHKDFEGFSKGFAFIKFKDVETASRIKQELVGREFFGRKLVINFAKPPPPQRVTYDTKPTKTVWVGNLAFHLTDEDLNALFRPFKNIRDVRIAVDRRTGQPRGFAHADFLDIASATEAQKVLNGKEVGGRIVKASFSQAKSRKVYSPKNQTEDDVSTP